MRCTRGLCCKWTTGVLGLVFLATGCILIKVFDSLIHNKVDDGLPLKRGSESYKNWVSPPAPIFFQIWVQHVANHDEVIKTGAKPVLVEKGPYTYREKRQKANITYHPDNSISYVEKQFFFFDRKKSRGPENENFTTVNLPMLTIASLIKNEFGFIQTIVSAILAATDEHLFIELSVADLMWGYEDSLLKDVKEAAARFGIKLPIDDKFGLFYNKNGSDDGVYRIQSGIGGDIDHFAEILSWNGNSSLQYWNTPAANAINGSDGTLYPPFIDKSRNYYLFSSDLCRSLEISYQDSYTLKGIDLTRFAVPPRTFANVSVNPGNKGFCTPDCLPAGFLNVGVCRDGAPIIFSLPHFLDGAPEIRDRVVGMVPNREEHQSVIDIEPLTGVVMSAAKRLQINAFLTNISHISDTANFHEYVILPVLWLNESATIDDKSASDFKGQVLMALKVTDAVQYGLIALGAFLLVCIIFVIIKSVFFKPREREEDDDPMLPSA